MHAKRTLIAMRLGVLALLAWSTLAVGQQPTDNNDDAERQLIRLTTLEWPPYTTSELPGGGVTTSLLRDALNASGFRLEVRFRPWQRARAEAANDPEVHGYFPEYFATDVAQSCHLSVPVGISPLGLAHRREDDFDWETLEDLGDMTLGVVEGYVNTGPFDRAWEAGRLEVETTSNDLLNLRRLVAGRIDVAVIDPLVMSHLIANQQPHWKNQVRFHPRPLSYHSLYVCFQRDALPQQARLRINQAITDLNPTEYMARYFETITQEIASGYLPEDTHMPMVSDYLPTNEGDAPTESIDPKAPDSNQ